MSMDRIDKREFLFRGVMILELRRLASELGIEGPYLHAIDRAAKHIEAYEALSMEMTEVDQLISQATQVQQVGEGAVGAVGRADELPLS